VIGIARSPNPASCSAVPLRPFALKIIEPPRFSPVLSSRKGEFRQPGTGLFYWVTLVPHYPFMLLPIALCVESAVKYEAAATLQARLSPRP
jgi:hypothetical protein